MSRPVRSASEVQRVLCHGNPQNPECAQAQTALAAELMQAGFDVKAGVGAFKQHAPDLLVFLGGDGFLMESLRTLGYPPTPVFGVNFGSVGFLMNRRELLGELVQLIRTWGFKEEQHAVLEANLLLEDGSTRRKLAFNDVVVERMTRQSVRLEIYLDGVPFDKYAGDGFVLSTTAGSTAYNLAAGGPVVHPALQVLIVTPLYPHRASPFHSMQFPLVVPLSSTVRIVAADLPKRRMRIVLDGESVQDVRSVEVSDSRRKVRLLRPSTHLFVKTLSRKFIGE